MIKPHARMFVRCVQCAATMRFSCQEPEASGFLHDVFECTKCRSTQSYVTPAHSNIDLRKPSVAERRSSCLSRPENKNILVPSEQHLSLFLRRVRRAMQDANSRHLFCIQSDENEARAYPDVLRVLEWIEDVATAG